MRARDVMTSPVITVRPGTSVKEAAALLVAHGFTALPVVDDEEQLVGIVTEADVVRGRIPRDPRARIWRQEEPVSDPPGATVGEVMTSPVVVAAAGTDVGDVARTMLERGIRSVPVVEGSRVVGIVSRRDLVRTITRDDQVIARDVRHRLEIYGGRGRWTVEVRQGAVRIRDEYHDPTDRHVAAVLAQAVPGVVHVEVESTPS
ncbi:MAG TPA: CBS domain-containing protein [Pseudonocardiaceae bacterium]